jgi:Amt family ammonium transporter
MALNDTEKLALYADWSAGRQLQAQLACGSSDEAATAETQQFLFFCGTLVFFMQCGFAMLSAGSVGHSTVVNIIFKNVSDAMLGAFVWWMVGYAFAFGNMVDGRTEFIGNDGFFLENVNPCKYAFWFYQWTFAATATTIVSGSVAGRTKLLAYFTYAIFMTGFIYPVVVHWVWSDNAWLTNGGYSDFAGSGVVHVVGGAAGLMGAIVVGPRDDLRGSQNSPHSMPLVALGTLILMFGFFGFNGGSVLAMDTAEDAASMASAVIVTVLGGSGGSISASVTSYYCKRRWSLMVACNGGLAGMVCICGGANVFEPWAGFVVGLVGGVVYMIWSAALQKIKIDDPLDAAPVHLGAGIWGVIAVPLFATKGEAEGIFYEGTANGGSSAWTTLGWNIAGVITIMVWTMGTSFPMFMILKAFGVLRVPKGQIVDSAEHGELAYSLSSNSLEGLREYNATEGAKSKHTEDVTTPI